MRATGQDSAGPGWLEEHELMPAGPLQLTEEAMHVPRCLEGRPRGRTKQHGPA
jgi:hypothetical protein